MKVFKKILIGLLIIFIILQAFRPDKNLSGNTEHSISKTYPVPDDVNVILAKACYDCHSNKTRYPWYANLQPVAWWLSDHVNSGKHDMNFDEFSSYRIRKQYKKLEECIDLVKEGEMPLSSYTIIHKDAKLTDTEKTALLNWFEKIRDTMRAKYPPDSLISKRR